MHLLIRRTRECYERKQNLGDLLLQWDLKIPYFEFRKELRKIGEMSLGQNFESIIPWADPDAVLALKPGSWVLPISEGDWLHPGFVESLRKVRISERCKFLTWGVLKKEADGAGPKDLHTIVENCGYALKLPTEWKFIHERKWISEQPIRETHHIKPVLAIRNETPASLDFLVKRESPRDAVRTAVKNRICDQKRLFHWTKPQADAYYSLLETALD